LKNYIFIFLKNAYVIIFKNHKNAGEVSLTSSLKNFTNKKVIKIPLISIEIVLFRNHTV